MNQQQGKKLIGLAKESIRSYLFSEELVINPDVKSEFSEKRGVFVTLKKNEELRGCIGYIEPVFELWVAVVRAAHLRTRGLFL